jgi:hypothetical protein
MTTVTIDYVSYSLSGTTATVTGFVSPPNNWDLVIPSIITNLGTSYNVTIIANNAFQNCLNLISVNIPNIVTSIGTSAFMGCKNIKILNIPSSLQIIQDYTFRGCEQLINLIIPATITSIGYSATFFCKGLKNVVFYGLIPSMANENFTGGGAYENIIYDPSLNVGNPNLSKLSLFATINLIPNPPIPGIDGNFLYRILNVACIPVCFPSGTPVETDQGLVNIEKIFSKTNTIRGEKIIAITKTVTIEDNIVCIEKNSLGPNIPSKKTFISRNHKLLFNEKMVKSKKLVGIVDGVKYVKYNGEILYNVLLETYEKMIVNNLIVETLDPMSLTAKLYDGTLSKNEINIIVSNINNYKKVLNYTK